MSEKAPDFTPAPGILPEGMYGPDNLHVTTKDKVTGERRLESGDERGFHIVSRGELPTELQSHFANHPEDTVFLKGNGGAFKAYKPDVFAAIQDEAYEARQAEREGLAPLFEAAEQADLEMTRPSIEHETVPQEVIKQLGKTALEATNPQATDEALSVARQEKTAERTPVFSSAELSNLNGLIQEMTRQASVFRAYGEQGRAKHDGNIVEQASAYLKRLKTGQENADTAMVAISAILGGVTGASERQTVFDMMRDAQVLSDKELQAVNAQAVHLGELDRLPGAEADRQKFSFAEHLSRQANAERIKHDGLATKQFLVLMSMVSGVGSRIGDTQYRQRVVDSAFREIAHSQR